MPKAILHIGTMKTGTTSIQAALAGNCDVLSDCGYSFFGPPMRHSSTLKPALKSIKENADNLIISDEGLWHFANTKRSDTAKLAELLSGYDVTVLIYLRRPDSFLNSWFQQGLKSGTGSGTMTEFLASSFVNTGLQFETLIANFDMLFGRGSVRLRPYEHPQLHGGDAVSDFLHTVDLPIERFKIPKRSNETPDTDDLLLRSLLRRPSDHAHKMSAQLDKVEKHLDRYGYKGRRYSLLTREELTRLNDTYKPIFRILQEKYGGGDNSDFFQSWANPDDVNEGLLGLRKTQEAIMRLASIK